MSSKSELVQTFSIIPCDSKGRATYSCDAVVKAHVEEYFNDIMKEAYPPMKITTIYNELENHIDIDDFYFLCQYRDISPEEARKVYDIPLPWHIAPLRALFSFVFF